METFYLVEPMDTADTAILERWVRGHGGTVDDVVELPDPGAADVSAGPLRERLRVGGDPLLAPVRVAWLPKERNGTRASTCATWCSAIPVGRRRGASSSSSAAIPSE